MRDGDVQRRAGSVTTDEQTQKTALLAEGGEAVP